MMSGLSARAWPIWAIWPTTALAFVGFFTAWWPIWANIRMLIASIALVLATSSAIAGDANEKSTTWCWSPDVTTRGNCVYSLRQCQEIVRLRRAGVCHRPRGYAATLKAAGVSPAACR